MKTVVILVAFCLLVACQPTPEDRDFFYSGWVNPNETGRARVRDEPIRTVPPEPQLQESPIP